MSRDFGYGEGVVEVVWKDSHTVSYRITYPGRRYYDDHVNNAINPDTRQLYWPMTTNPVSLTKAGDSVSYYPGCPRDIFLRNFPEMRDLTV